MVGSVTVGDGFAGERGEDGAGGTSNGKIPTHSEQYSYATASEMTTDSVDGCGDPGGMNRPDVTPTKYAQHGYLYCMARSTRATFISGDDPYDGQNYDYRRPWFDERMRQLASIFAVHVYAVAVQSKQLHLVLHVDPDRAAGWSDAEVVARESVLHRPATWSIARILDRQMQWKQDPQRMAELRRRLGSFSGYMSALRQPIAQRANREKGTSGHFWESRLQRRRLHNDDEAAGAIAVVQRLTLGENIPLLTRKQQSVAMGLGPG